MKIALTGAMGLVGRYTSAELARAGHQVVALTHHPSQDCAFPQKVVDITDFPAVREAVRGCDAVIHLAAIPHPAGDKDSSVMHTNVIGDYNVVLAGCWGSAASPSPPATARSASPGATAKSTG